MIGKNRTAVLSVGLMVGLFGVGIGAYSMIRLPPPQKCDDAGILRWLATRDLEVESREIQQALLHRILQRLEEGVELKSGGDSRLAQYQSTVDSNVNLLLHLFLDEKVEEFSALPRKRRAGWSETQLNWLEATGLVRLLQELSSSPVNKSISVDESGNEKGTPQMVELTQLLVDWSDCEDVQQSILRKQMIGSIQTVWFQRTIHKLLPTLWSTKEPERKVRN